MLDGTAVRAGQRCWRSFYAAPALPGDDASLSTDRYRAAYTLGRVSMGDLDYVGALAHFSAALAEAEWPAARIQALLGQAQAGTFVDPMSSARFRWGAARAKSLRNQ